MIFITAKIQQSDKRTEWCFPDFGQLQSIIVIPYLSGNDFLFHFVFEAIHKIDGSIYFIEIVFVHDKHLEK